MSKQGNRANNKMAIIKQLSKALLLLMVIGSAATFSYYLYLKWPTGLDKEVAKPAADTLKELLVFVEQHQGVNPNLLASSTYRPDEPLYAALVAIQQQNWTHARELLKPLVDQGNADAMFWLAEISYRSNVFAGSDGAELFKAAAKLGNPYAAIRLTPKYNRYSCEMRMRRDCDDAWGDVAIELLKQRSAAGDLKAEYALLAYARYDRPDAEYFHHYLALVKKSAEQNYFRPLNRLVEMYFDREQLSPFDESKNPLTESDKQALLQLLTYAANNNNLDSAALIYWNFSDLPHATETANNTIIRNLSTITKERHSNIALDYWVDKGKQQREALLLGFAYAKAWDDATLGEADARQFTPRNQRSLSLSQYNADLAALSDEEQAQAIAEYGAEIELQPVIYLDGISGAWDDSIF